ncbi:MAG TPA: hypothetical protein VLK26_01330 [Rudaea sp.]|nr:hypothetical protein [Rudaea sp.]
MLCAFAAFLQARFQQVGAVEQGADGILAAAFAAVAQPQPQYGQNQADGDDDESGFDADFPVVWRPVCTNRAPW